MKLLLSVITALLRINGVIGVLLVLLVMSMREQKSGIATKDYQLGHDAENFRRNLQEADAEYQRQIQENQAKLQSKEKELQLIKAELNQIKGSAVMGNSTDDLADPQSPNPDPKINSAATIIAAKTPREVTSVSTKTGHQNQNNRTIVKKQGKEASKPSSQVSQNPKKQLQQPTLAKPEIVTSVFSRTQQNVSSQTDINFSTSTVALEKTSVPKPSTIKMFKVSSTPKADNGENGNDNFQAVKTSPKYPQKSQESATNSGTLAEQNQSSDKEASRNKAIHLANDLTIGLLVAGQKRQINYGTRTYRKVQTAISSLRKGTSLNLEQASARSNLETSVLQQVAKWGEKRPGSLEGNPQVSLANTNEIENESIREDY